MPQKMHMTLDITDIDFSNVPVEECKIIQVNTPRLRKGTKRLKLKMMDELLKGNAIFWNKTANATELRKSEKKLIWNHIDLSHYENPLRDTGEKPLDLNDTNHPHVTMSKQLYVIPNCTLDHPIFTIKYHVHDKTGFNSFRFWEECDLRANGEPWIRPNMNTFRCTVSLPLLIAQKDFTFQMEISEFNQTLPHHQPYADMMKFSDIKLDGKWDKCLIYERTRVDTTKFDALRKLKFLQFFKQFNGGVLIKSIQFGVYKCPGMIPMSIQDKCIKKLSVRFQHPVYNRKFVLGIATVDDMPAEDFIDLEKHQKNIEQAGEFVKQKFNGLMGMMGIGFDNVSSDSD